MKYPQPASLLAATCLLAAAAAPLQAEIKLPAIFGDHMVLQEDQNLPLWGKADPGDEITVTAGTESAKATADATGKWMVKLEPLPLNATPITVRITDKAHSITLNDVLVGEVWICSGQSNMAFILGGAHNSKVALPEAHDSKLRFFRVAKKSSLDPSDDVTGKWELCTPETARDFSAVGYFFAKDIRQDLHKPVGLIGSYWGGSPAQAWTSISGLQKRPELKHYVADVEKTRADFSKATAAYPAAVAKYQTQVDAWTKSPDGTAYTAAYKAWRDVNNKAKEAGQDSMRAPGTPKSKPKPPVEPDGGYKSPVVVYNGMIAPLIPYAIKGVIWYQGEENGHKGYEYRALFPNMISDWREKWGQGDFPFIFVQLPNYNESVMQVWPFLREAQAMTLSLPNTGMATGIDVGDPKNIHPQDKVDIGHRVALVARHVAYNEQLVYTGPTYGSMKIEGNSIHVTYTTKGSDLVIGKAPWVAPGAQPRPTDKLLGFTITGDDKKWAPANATISGDEVIVSSPQVPKPVAVRYNWANAPEGNLYNKAGLPAFPFRSDNWSDPAAGIGQP